MIRESFQEWGEYISSLQNYVSILSNLNSQASADKMVLKDSSSIAILSLHLTFSFLLNVVRQMRGHKDITTFFIPCKVDLSFRKAFIN